MIQIKRVSKQNWIILLILIWFKINLLSISLMLSIFKEIEDCQATRLTTRPPLLVKSFFFWELNSRPAFGANLKKQFFTKFCTKFVIFLHFSALYLKKNWKWLYWPVLWVRSTQKLVEISNRHLLKYEGSVCAFVSTEEKKFPNYEESDIEV